MTAPVKLTDTERELLAAWKRIDLDCEDPIILDHVKKYSRLYALYRMQKVASELWQSGSYDGARAMLLRIEETTP